MRNAWESRPRDSGCKRGSRLCRLVERSTSTDPILSLSAGRDSPVEPQLFLRRIRTFDLCGHPTRFGRSMTPTPHQHRAVASFRLGRIAVKLVGHRILRTPSPPGWQGNNTDFHRYPSAGLSRFRRSNRATANSVVLLDGAGLSDVDNGGCVHGVAWYVRRPGGELLTRLADERPRGLTDILADAIDDVAEAHKESCDLDHPGTPSSTVIIADHRGSVVRYLVLADSVLVVNDRATQHVISDAREQEVGRLHRGRMDALRGGSPAHAEARREYVETLRAYRNRPGGFRVAAANADAASQAITGRVATDKIQSVLLLSDGASRLVDRFGLSTWEEVTRLIADSGVRTLLQRVRDAEHSDPHGRRWPRGKIYDDATLAYCDFPHAQAPRWRGRLASGAGRSSTASDVRVALHVYPT